MEGVSKQVAMAGFVSALHESSWENLEQQHPAIARNLKAAVKAGAGPDDIFYSAVESGHSPELAKWCRVAATFLASE